MKAHVAEGDEVGRMVARAAGDGAQVPHGARALLPAREQRALQAVLAEVRWHRCTAAQIANLREDTCSGCLVLLFWTTRSDYCI